MNINMSSASFYKWRTKYGGMDADVQLQNDVIKKAATKNSATALLLRDDSLQYIYNQPSPTIATNPKGYSLSAFRF